MMIRIQRPDNRSYRTWGSLVKLTGAFVITDEKKMSGSALITPSAAPVVLLNVRSLPLTKIKNCDGPTAPIESGGKAPVCVGPVTPSKVTPTVWAAYGPEVLLIEDVEMFRAEPGAVCRSRLAAGSCGRCSRPGISNSR